METCISWMKTSFSWITKINPVSWRELLIFCHPKLQCFCFLISKLVRLPLQKCIMSVSVPRYISSVFHLCNLNRFVRICIYEETNVLEIKATLHFLGRKTETSSQATGMELWRDALLFLYLLKLFNCRKQQISQLFCKVNTLNIA